MLQGHVGDYDEVLITPRLKSMVHDFPEKNDNYSPPRGALGVIYDDSKIMCHDSAGDY